MTPLEIKFQLSLHGTSQSEIARACKVKHPSVHRVIEGLSRSRRIEERIAAAIKKPLHEIWPHWHSEAGKKRKKPLSLTDRISKAKDTVAQLEQLAKREAA